MITVLRSSQISKIKMASDRHTQVKIILPHFYVAHSNENVGKKLKFCFNGDAAAVEKLATDIYIRVCYL